MAPSSLDRVDTGPIVPVYAAPVIDLKVDSSEEYFPPAYPDSFHADEYAYEYFDGEDTSQILPAEHPRSDLTGTPSRIPAHDGDAILEED
jgi:hypothetical protein